jgi:hypothetical protein
MSRLTSPKSIFGRAAGFAPNLRSLPAAAAAPYQAFVHRTSLRAPRRCRPPRLTPLALLFLGDLELHPAAVLPGERVFKRTRLLESERGTPDPPQVAAARRDTVSIMPGTTGRCEWRAPAQRLLGELQQGARPRAAASRASPANTSRAAWPGPPDGTPAPAPTPPAAPAASAPSRVAPGPSVAVRLTMVGYDRPCTWIWDRRKITPAGHAVPDHAPRPSSRRTAGSRHGSGLAARSAYIAKRRMEYPCSQGRVRECTPRSSCRTCLRFSLPRRRARH